MMAFLFSFSAELPFDSATEVPVTLPANNPPSESIWQLLLIVIVFVGVLILAYFFTKIVGGGKLLGINSRRGRNIDIVESRALGANNGGVQLLRVGACYYLIGVTKERITFLSEIDREKLDLGTEAHNTYISEENGTVKTTGNGMNQGFEGFLNKYWKKRGSNNKNGGGDE